MARLPRLAVAGHLHLLLQRGHGGHAVFASDDDYRLYLETLRHVAREYQVAIHAYALLPGCVLLLATPSGDESLGRMLQALGRRFGATLNRQRGRTGSLWDGRFRCAVLDADEHLIDAVRYVEESPVRAGLTADAWDYAWSSAGHHAGRRRESWLMEHQRHWQLGNTPFEREARHRELLNEPLPEPLRQRMTTAVEKSWALGSSRFIALLSTLTARPLGPRVRGRPRHVVSSDHKTVPK